MAGFKVNFTNPFARQRVNKARINALIEEELEILWLQSIEAFVRAVALSGVVRVDTGMSRASIIPLARVVSLGSKVSSSISADQKTRGGRKPYQEGGAKSKTRGERLGQKAFRIKISRSELEFEFDIVIFQWNLYENGFRGAAWRSLDIGRAAFNSSLEANLPRFNRRVAAILNKELLP